jgi:tripartite-type tricarboxylate transporter receptor subunit TctC
MRRSYRGAVLLLAAGVSHAAWSQQAYPTRAIRLIVPSSPGGTSDILARIVGQKLAESLGQQVVVDNRAGGGGTIGVDLVCKAAPDGYTLLITPASLAINPSVVAKLPYNAQRDLAPLTQLVAAANVLVVHPSVAATNVKQLIALGKTKPKSVVAGSAGAGTSPHLSAELFKSMAGIDMLIVHYKGSGAVMGSLLGGEVGLSFPTLPTTMPHIKSGKLRALGVTTLVRAPALPDVPTIAEAGLPGYEATQWFGMLVPVKTPRPLVERLHREITRAMQAPDVKERLAGEGAQIVASTPEDFSAYIKAETDKWAKVVKVAGIKPE